MIRINLLPHREMRREQRKKQFIAHAVVAAAVGAAVVFAGGVFVNGQIDTQNGRNQFVKSAIAKLDVEIAEIQALESEILALQARQKAVEDLQADRTIPVHLFDEMVKLTPEGVYLNKLVQDDLKVTMSGYAQSNERVADFLRNLSDRSPWIEKPQLDEIKEVSVNEPLLQSRSGARADARGEARRVFDFSLNVLLKRRAAVVAAEADKAAAQAGKAASAAGAPATLAAVKEGAHAAVSGAALSVVKPRASAADADAASPGAAASKVVSK